MDEARSLSTFFPGIFHDGAFDTHVISSRKDGGYEPFPPGTKVFAKYKGDYEAAVVSSVPLMKELQNAATENRPPNYTVDLTDSEDPVIVPFTAIHHP